jgi:hypothetical protein
MFTAATARSQGITTSVTETEIALLNLNIIKSLSAGNLTTTLSSNTVTTVSNTTVTGSPMTSDINYYFSWTGATANNLATAQMQTVMDNFTKLGYTISRQSYDGQHIYWQVSW